MKMLVHRTAASAAQPFDLAELKNHLRVDFDEDDSAIGTIGKTAAAEIEQFAQIALLTQTIRATIFDPFVMGGVSLPVGPILDGGAATVTIDGESFTAFDLVAGIRPYLRWRSAYHDLQPTRIIIEYDAGFGAAASDIPPDLAQALMDQAALHYDGRSPVNAKAHTTSPHMARIGARYRGVRV